MKRKYYGKRGLLDILFDPVDRDINHDMWQREQDALIGIAVVFCLVVLAIRVIFF